MSSFNAFLIIAMVVATSFGALAFKQFTIAREVVWLLAGLVAYNASSIAWIMLIDQAGLARAMVLAAAAQIILTTLAGIYFGERIGVFGFAAAALACVAGALTLLGPTSVPNPTPEILPNIKEEHVDERSR